MLEDRVAFWLAEDDVGEDVTSLGVVPEGARGRARLVAGEACVVAGLDAALAVLEGEGVRVEARVEEGARVEAGEALLAGEGPARWLLGRERVACNVVGRLSGVASLTRRAVDAVEEAGLVCEVLATRKTTPGLGDLEVQAVRAGGGGVHRESLSGSVLVKENHLAFVSVGEAVKAARSFAPDRFVMVEAETVEEALAVARSGADGVLFDNFDAGVLEDAVELVKKIEPGIVTEASGSITAEDVVAYAAHVDRVSLGQITHSAPCVDVSMRVEPA